MKLRWLGELGIRILQSWALSKIRYVKLPNKYIPHHNPDNRRLCCTSGDPIHGWLRSLVDPVTRLVEENPRVGWTIHKWGGGIAWGKGTGSYGEG